MTRTQKQNKWFITTMDNEDELQGFDSLSEVRMQLGTARLHREAGLYVCGRNWIGTRKALTGAGFIINEVEN